MAPVCCGQEPVAVVGFACRLPGGNLSPTALWDFLTDGRIADNRVPPSRFNVSGHYDGSHKPGTMRPPGGMFLDPSVDLTRLDAGFFEISGTEAIAMDPNQRQMLEVVYEGLETAGIPLEALDGRPVACFVGSFSSDYGDAQNRDPNDRPVNNAIGVGRSIMANRISYFLNIKGPSVTIDTACSGSLVALDMACSAVRSGQVDTAIVATSNIYLSPEHVIDIGSGGQAHSVSGFCHAFDAAADGYVKAEAVSCVIVKRLGSALRDRDPIRAVIRGLASNSNGRTTGGIATPSAAAQVAAIRSAYTNAGLLACLGDTQYLECHGTGTQVGDSTEAHAIGVAFAATRRPEKPLIIGSIKSNVGHSEPAAGLSGLIKTVLAIEKGIIPGTPLFINPNPQIDFAGNHIKASRLSTSWPDTGGKPRRASLNSFGYGGSNAHAVIEEAPPHTIKSYTHSMLSAEEALSSSDGNHVTDDSSYPKVLVLVLSANDASSLQANIEALCSHLTNPRVRLSLPSLAYTLSERRSQLWHRAFFSTSSLADWRPKDFTVGKKRSPAPPVGFIFTGQGSQWPAMGRELLEHFPVARAVLEELDAVLQSLGNGDGDGRLQPRWSLLREISEPRAPEHVRRPELAQPLVTALQLGLLAVLESWHVRPASVVGHSSGEIAAAYTAGFLDRAGAIKAAYYRGQAASVILDADRERLEGDAAGGHGMLAVGLSAEALMPLLGQTTVTVSGTREALELLADELKTAGHSARFLFVDLAYHSELISRIGDEYWRILDRDGGFREGCQEPRTGISMFSTLTASALNRTTRTDALYWKANMTSPVRFQQAFEAMLSQPDGLAPEILVEVGPSGALAGPILQMIQSHPGSERLSYFKSWERSSTEASKALLDLAGQLFVQGVPVDLAAANAYSSADLAPHTVVDLPSYCWNHSATYWHESAASLDWRFRRFVAHDLIGSKVLGVPWQGPACVWRNKLRLDDVPWLRHHKMGANVLMPGAGMATMAIEAMFQKFCAVHPDYSTATPNELAYRLRNVRFDRAMVLEDDAKGVAITLSLTEAQGGGSGQGWGVGGLIRVVEPVDADADTTTPAGADLSPLRFPQSFAPWYQAQHGIGMGFGPAFKKIIALESVAGQRSCRALVDLTPPPSRWEPQSYYSPFHPAVLDGCLLVATPAKVYGERSLVHDLVVPGVLDEVFVNRVPHGIREGLSIAKSRTTGLGRPDKASGTVSDLGVYDPESGAVLVEIRGLHDVELNIGRSPDQTPLAYLEWKPDISMLTHGQLAKVEPGKECGTVQRLPGAIMDLMAFKKPSMKILEVNLSQDDASSVWFRNDVSTTRKSYSQCDLASSNAQVLVRMRSNYESERNSSFSLINPEKDALGLSTDVLYDLIIVRLSLMSHVEMEKVVQRSRALVGKDSFILLMGLDEKAAIPFKGQAETQFALEALETTSSSSSSPVSNLPEVATSTSDFSPTKTDLTETPIAIVHSANPDVLEPVVAAEEGPAIYLCQNGSPGFTTSQETTESKSRQRVARVLVSANQTRIGALGHNRWGFGLLPHPHPQPPKFGLTPGVILILDELTQPLLTSPTVARWAHLQSLVASGRPLLWVTRGSQHAPVTDPDSALVHGLFRVARRENYGAAKLLHTLDVDPASCRGGGGGGRRRRRRRRHQGATILLSADSEDAVCRVLDAMRDGRAEGEYSERGGLLHIQRVVPDAQLAQVSRPKPLERGLWEGHGTRELRAERVGGLELIWCETKSGRAMLEKGCIEVEVEAVGVNFKDVATTMGIIQGNEHMLGCECSGVVRRLGQGVTKFKEGDRVAVMKAGTYANVIHTPAERAHAIPDTMSFNEAASIPLVFMTALYSMFYLGNLEEGQSVLIHSAAGGVGLAAIQLARLKKCQTFVTVGTEAKKTFLSTTFGIPPSHIFSSRSDRFGQDILIATDGRGVDLVLNSLAGELLDTSWRIVADGGTMVEIGKRDILDRNSLAMEPFGRNCSFRAVDLSCNKHITDSMVARLLAEVFGLVSSGRIQPIQPTTLYGFDKVPDALAFMRRGQHIGKLVISRNNQRDVRVPIRSVPPQLRLRSDVAYLLVGGLKGLCGSLAIHMARSGARNIIVCCRSGIADPVSRKVERDCRSYGCEVSEAKGDITNKEFVRSLFSLPYPGPIAGVIQGAMVLRDTPYETMSVADYCSVTDVKVQGTWNLHDASIALLNQPLDFFTLLSSLSGVVGNKGQANYAAAGTFLDAFAHYRHSLHLCAHVLDLGVVQEVGYMAGPGAARGLEEKFGKGQWTSLGERALRRVFDYSILMQQDDGALSRGSAAQLVTGLPVPLDESSDLATDARFGYLLEVDAAMPKDEQSEHFGKDGDNAALLELQVLRSSPETTRQALVQSCVRVLMAKIALLLHLETEVEPDKQLAAYGLDSLSAVELRGWLRACLSADLSALDITNAPSLTSLAEKIIERLPEVL
ncbi:beta-ketoacyl synthase domain-containing protein [Apiospora sp. TS-2023a]